ncbi:hypothetical protein [uncultured Ramlibacter sp.]|uniref:hypothetical protein n=1 Tax=uncultured Ramlibacter sp. TaxID=260755 RepID=UPI00262B2215|nr:hypothetical protein [uncultured Ramlibacter sp.]
MSDGSDKLARSRQAIVEHVRRKARRREERANDGLDAAGPDDEDTPFDNGRGGWLGGLRHAARSWWRHHPAQLALQLATPALSSFARRKPVVFLGVAAGLGALVLVARPWKLVSATGLLVALLKSSQLSGLVMSAMSAADFEKDHQRYR